MIKRYLLIFNLLCFSIFSMEIKNKINNDNLISSIGESGFALHKIINKNNDENTIYSPFSICSSLFVILNGSDAETEREIKHALKLSLSGKHLSKKYNRLYTDLFTTNKPCKFLLSNMILMNTYSEILESFKKSTTSFFHAKIESGKPIQNKIDQINRYFATRTNFNIIDILSSLQKIDNIKLLSINTLFFKSTWSKPFNTSETSPGPFLNNFQNMITTYKMRQTSQFLYNESSDFQTVLLPIDCNNKNTDINFVVLLPKNKNNFKNLNWNSFNQILDNLSYTYLDLKIPVFSLNQKYLLKEQLTEIGIRQAFTPFADFSKINEKSELYLNNVIHACSLNIDENGINAADEDIKVDEYKVENNVNAVLFDINRPFYFVICDLKSKTILFVGMVKRLDRNI